MTMPALVGHLGFAQRSSVPYALLPDDSHLTRDRQSQEEGGGDKLKTRWSWDQPGRATFHNSGFQGPNAFFCLL